MEDEDGCPDESDEPVEWTRQEIFLKEEVYFNTDRAKLQDRSRPILKKLANFLLAHPEMELVEIQGHADDRGTQEWNLDLSQRRAANVKKYLVRAGVAEERLKTRGYGKRVPAIDGVSPKARALNRRVQFKIIKTREP